MLQRERQLQQLLLLLLLLLLCCRTGQRLRVACPKLASKRSAAGKSGSIAAAPFPVHPAKPHRPAATSAYSCEPPDAVVYVQRKWSGSAGSLALRAATSWRPGQGMACT